MWSGWHLALFWLFIFFYFCFWLIFSFCFLYTLRTPKPMVTLTDMALERNCFVEHHTQVFNAIFSFQSMARAIWTLHVNHKFMFSISWWCKHKESKYSGLSTILSQRLKVGLGSAQNDVHIVKTLAKGTRGWTLLKFLQLKLNCTCHVIYARPCVNRDFYHERVTSLFVRELAYTPKYEVSPSLWRKLSVIFRFLFFQFVDFILTRSSQSGNL